MKENMEQVFREAFEQHSDELFRHAALRLSDRDRALEITQECFLRAWGYAQKGKEIREIRPFLFKTLRNLIIDDYRKTKSFSLDEMLEGEDGGQIDALTPRDNTNTLEAAVDRFEGARAVEAVLELPDPYREVFALRYIDSLTVSEIAALIQESENVVSVRLHRGLKKLKKILEEQT